MEQQAPPLYHFVRCLKCYKILKCSRYDTTALLDHIRDEHPEIQMIESNSQIRKSTGGSTYDQKLVGDEKRFSRSSRHSKDYTQAASRDIGDSAEYYTKGQRDTAETNISFTSDAATRPKESQYFEEQQLQAEMLKREKSLDQKEAFFDTADEINIPTIKVCDEKATDIDADVNGKLSRTDSKIIYTRRYTVNTPQSPKTARKRKLYRTSIEKWRPANGTLYCPKCCCNTRPLIKTRSERLATNKCGAACILSCWPFCFLPCIIPGDDSKEYLHCANCKNFLGLYDRKNNCIKPNKAYVDCMDSARQKSKMDE